MYAFVNITAPFKRVSFSPPERRWHCYATFDELWRNAWDQPHQISLCVNLWFLKVGKSCVCDGDGVSCSQKWHTQAVNLRLTAGAKVYTSVLHLSYPCNSCLLLPRTHVRYTGSRRFRRSRWHRFSLSIFRVQLWTSFTIYNLWQKSALKRCQVQTIADMFWARRTVLLSLSEAVSIRIFL